MSQYNNANLVESQWAHCSVIYISIHIYIYLFEEEDEEKRKKEEKNICYFLI